MTADEPGTAGDEGVFHNSVGTLIPTFAKCTTAASAGRDGATVKRDVWAVLLTIIDESRTVSGVTSDQMPSTGFEGDDRVPQFLYVYHPDLGGAGHDARIRVSGRERT